MLKEIDLIKLDMTKAFYFMSNGRIEYEQASQLADKYAPIWADARRRYDTLAHKGPKWFAGQVLKSIQCRECHARFQESDVGESAESKNVVPVERDTGDVNPHQVKWRIRLNGNLNLIL